MDRISLNSVSTFPLTLSEALPHCARHGFRHVALWRDAIDPVGLAETRRLLKENDLTVSSICGWLLRDKASVTIEDKKRSIDIAAELGAKSVATLVPPYTSAHRTLEEARARGFDHVAELHAHGLKRGVTLALEPIHPGLTLRLSCLNSLDQAAQWCRLLGPGIGLELDLCNIWHEPDLAPRIERLHAEGLVAGVQLCDVRGDGAPERAVMGEGVADVAGFVTALKGTGYEGLYEVELIGQSLWDRPVDSYLTDIVRSCRSLGLA